MNLNRRSFLHSLGLASAAWMLPRKVGAQTAAPRVVVIGGGLGGATVAKYLRLWGGNIQVTLVDRSANHVACILSNLVVTGALGLDSITLGYGELRTKRGVEVLQGDALEVDPGARVVTVLANGEYRPLEYDKLILSPGIEFIPPPGNYQPGLTPHAWQAGPQTLLLKKMLASMKSRQNFILTIPKSPYRCPPGPYERACVVADYLKRRGIAGKVIVLDANTAIQAEPHNFGKAFAETYKDIIRYVPNAAVTSVDSATKTVVTTVGTFKGSVVNIIPAQRAGSIVTGAGLANDPTGRWAVVNPLSYASLAEPDIHILGDSQGTGQPKSGHMANSQAKVCADAMIRAFNGESPDPAPVTSSACFSPITSEKASWLTASYQYDSLSRAMKRVDASYVEAAEPTSDGMQQMFQWANNIFADSFS